MSWRCADAYGVDVGCSAPLTDREFKAFSVARKGHALALTANKAGTDIIGYGEETEVLALPGTGGDSGNDEDDDDDEGGWNKVEKDERDLRDDGDEDDGDDEGNIKDDVGDATTATTAATNTSLDPMDTWRDEVSLRGGRKRFVLDRPKLAKKRKPKRVNTSAETTCANDATPLNAFERERLFRVWRAPRTITCAWTFGERAVLLGGVPDLGFTHLAKRLAAARRPGDREFYHRCCRAG